MLRGGSGPESPGGDAEERKTPVVVGEGVTHQTAQGSAYVGVGRAEAGRLRVRRCCAAIGPSRAGVRSKEFWPQPLDGPREIFGANSRAKELKIG